MCDACASDCMQASAGVQPVAIMSSRRDHPVAWGLVQVAGVVVGKGFRFGYRAAGDTAALEQLGRQLGLTVEVVDLVQRATATDDIISSSKV